MWPGLDNLSRFFDRLALETSIFSLYRVIDRPTKLQISNNSVKPEHKYYSFTGFTEEFEKFGRSDDDMIYIVKK